MGGAVPYDTLIQGGRVVLPGHGVQETDLAIEGERIAAILGAGSGARARATVDARGLHVLPGALDSHTHWGYRGDFAVQCESDSRAAAIGGTTTALLFHRIEPGQFPELRRLGEARATTDFTFSPAIFSEATAAPVEEAITAWGCPSFKFYLAYRRIPGAPPGDDWNGLDDGLMLDVLERLARWEGTLACVHAENADINNRGIARVRARGGDGLAAWEEANPGIAEAEAVLRAGLYAERTGVPVYYVHLSGRDALHALRRVRAQWPRTHGETCPHYLFHSVESSPAAVKFSPPVRHRADGEALWEALATGLLDSVGSDNAPTLSAAKQGSVWDMVRGGPGAGILLPLVLSEGVAKGRLTLERAVEVTSTSAARIFGLHPRKGSIQVGADADLALVDLGLEKTVTRELFGTWSDYTLYEGVRLRGWPVMTMLRGRIVVRDGAVQVAPGHGRFLPRQARLRERSGHSPSA
jgi:dihydropyrimidinase